jgi:hypothetical protein
MEAGRGFLPVGCRESPARVAVLSHQSWRTRFGATALSAARSDRWGPYGGRYHVSEFTGPEGARIGCGCRSPRLPRCVRTTCFRVALDRWQDCCVSDRTPRGAPRDRKRRRSCRC